VETMTMRHVVFRSMDGIRYIMPNSQLNEKTIINTSYKQRLWGTIIKFHVAHTADIRKAINVVRKVIRDCPYTFPNNTMNDDLDGYGEVYVTEFENSAIILETTIWTEPTMDFYLASSEIRMSVIEAFRKHGIEIPYNYTNVIMRDRHEDIQYITPVKRNISLKSDIVEISNYKKDLNDCHNAVYQICEFLGVSVAQQTKLQLIEEELLGFANLLVHKEKMEFWIEGNKEKIRMNVQTVGAISKSKQLAIINNSSNSSIPKQFLTNLTLALTRNLTPNGWLFESQNVSDGGDLEKMILSAYADDIKIGFNENRLIIVVTKALTYDKKKQDKAKKAKAADNETEAKHQKKSKNEKKIKESKRLEDKRLEDKAQTFSGSAGFTEENAVDDNVMEDNAGIIDNAGDIFGNTETASNGAVNTDAADIEGRDK
ncbi:MAG: mechanosensitive ion channel family protein, partial [Lachnospiraceae bacterium]|nr:mechanosensitive ion channel family protein [Lachnospiraceae bacterium]